MKQNEWFKQLRDKGYSISVYQSSWLDLCKNADRCYTYGNSLSSLQQLSLPTRERIQILLGVLAKKPKGGMYPLGAMVAFKRFMADIKQRPRGTAYVLHLIFPHAGYLYRDDCSLADPDEWGGHRHHVNPMNTPDSRKALYGQYLNQVVCVSRLLNDLFDELKRLGTYDEARIVVHGDHGSRIAERAWYGLDADSLTERDMIDQFSTLLAVRTPNTGAGVKTAPVAIQDSFAKQFLGLEVSEDLANTVFVREPGAKFGAREIRWPAPGAPAAFKPQP